MSRSRWSGDEEAAGSSLGPPGPSPSRWFQGVAVGYLVLLFMSSPLALLWLGWFLSDGSDQISHRVHEVSFGTLFAFIFVGVAAQLRSADRQVAGMWQAVLVGLLFAIVEISASGSADPLLFVYVLPLVALVALHPARRRLFRPPIHPSGVLVLAALPLVLPLVVMAFDELDLASREVAGHLEHWGAMAAFAFAILALVLLACLRLPGWRVSAWSAAGGVLLYASVSVAYPGDASSAVLRSELWAGLAIAWSIAFLLVAERLVDRPARAKPERTPRQFAGRGLLTGIGVTGLVIVLLFVSMVWLFEDAPRIPHEVSETTREHCVSCHGSGINPETREQNVPKVSLTAHPGGSSTPPGRCVDCHEEGGYLEIEGASGVAATEMARPDPEDWEQLRVEQRGWTPVGGSP